MEENNLTEQQKIVYEIVKKHSQLVKNNPIRIRFIKPYDPIYIVIIKKIYRYCGNYCNYIVKCGHSNHH